MKETSEKKQKALAIVNDMQKQKTQAERVKDEDKRKEKCEFKELLNSAEKEGKNNDAFHYEQERKRKHEIVNQNKALMEINQQKKITEKERDKLYRKLQEEVADKSELERNKVH